MLNMFFEKIFSLIVLLLASPLLIIIAILIKIESPGPIFFTQERVGLNGKIFKIFKLRSMFVNSGLEITNGNTDKRITLTGKFIRKFYMDELVQFINVLKGDLNIVGPRPEILKYTNYYPELWKIVLSIKPGITSNTALNLATWEYELLASSQDFENTYINQILPLKLKSDIEYIKKRNCYKDVKIIFFTILKVFSLNYKVKL